MANKLIFHPHIPDDVVAAVTYYEEISSELANRFWEQVNRRLDDIAARPESFPMDVAPIRFARLERFRRRLEVPKPAGDAFPLSAKIYPLLENSTFCRPSRDRFAAFPQPSAAAFAANRALSLQFQGSLMGLSAHHLPHARTDRTC